MFIGMLMLIPFCLFSGIRLYKNINFGIDVTGHIKRAADVNTIELAKQEMDVVIKYLEENKITEGYTSILYRTPSEDIGFWYNNLKQSVTELEKGINGTQLEKTNVLMKLHETLVDHSESGVSVTCPNGISIYPNNTAFAIFGWMSFLFFIIGLGLIGIRINDFL
jgi:hypothetical protein